MSVEGDLAIPAFPVSYVYHLTQLRKIAPEIPDSVLGGRESIAFTINDIEKSSGIPSNNWRQMQTRGLFDPEDFGTIVTVCGRHAGEEFRLKLIENLMSKSGHKVRDTLSNLILQVAQHATETFKRTVLRSSLFGLDLPRKRREKRASA